jgi:kynurenine formamidase
VNNVFYDPFKCHSISLDDLHKCATAQGIDIRPEAAGGHIKVGDILFIRSGFVERYYSTTPAEKTAVERRPSHETEWAGVKQDKSMVTWLHDSYFAAVVGDSPTFEAWPSQEDYHLHEHLLALWGVPIGEMWDLER